MQDSNPLHLESLRLMPMHFIKVEMTINVIAVPSGKKKKKKKKKVI